MYDESGKLTISVSQEVSYFIEQFLVKSGIPASEAKSLSKNYRSIKLALQNSSLPQNQKEIAPGPPKPRVNPQFPLPSILSPEREPLPPLKLLCSQYYQLMESKQKASSMPQEESKGKPQAQPIAEKDSEYSGIIAYALSNGLSQGQAEGLAAYCDNFFEADRMINEYKSQQTFNMILANRQLPFPPIQPKVQSGEVFRYRIGLSLESSTCMICTEDFVLEEQLKSLYCFHTFHLQCIETWFKNDREMRCPNCNRTSKDIQSFAM